MSEKTGNEQAKRIIDELMIAGEALEDARWDRLQATFPSITHLGQVSSRVETLEAILAEIRAEVEAAHDYHSAQGMKPNCTPNSIPPSAAKMLLHILNRRDLEEGDSVP